MLSQIVIQEKKSKQDAGQIEISTVLLQCFVGIINEVALLFFILFFQIL